MTRFDIPEPIKDLLNTCIELKLVLEPTDIYALGSNYQYDWSGIVSEVSLIADCYRHTDPDLRSKVISQVDQCLVELNKLKG